MIDEKEANVRFIESAVEGFDDAIKDYKFFQAKAAIDRLADNGFTKEAATLAEQLLKAKSDYFL